MQSGSNAEAKRQVIKVNAAKHPFAEKTFPCESGMREHSGNGKEIEMAVNNQKDDSSKSEEISGGKKRFQGKENATQVKIKRVREKHPLRESCQSNCRLKCNMKILHFRRQNIWSSFWKLSHKERRAFAFSCIARKKPRRVSNKTLREK